MSIFGVRAKISTSIDADGLVCILIEWVSIIDEQIDGDPIAKEEFRLPVGSASSYISRMLVEKPCLLPGTFWLDKDGRRHFIVRAESGELSSVGSEVE